MEEQEKARNIALGHEEFEEDERFPNKTTRIRGYVEYYRNLGITEDYPEEKKERDIQRELIQQMCGQDACPNMAEKIALEYGAKYLSTLNDIEFFNLLRQTGLITEMQAKSLTRTYREIGGEGLRREVYESPEWVKIAKEQAVETAKIGQAPGEDDEISL